MEENLQWFAVRTLYRTGTDGDKGIYGERITLHRAPDAEAAAELAEEGLSRLLALNEGFTPIKQVGVYALRPDTADWNGQELWSVLYQGPTDPNVYYQEKYGKFELPDDGQ